jgi:hypothetical protein
MDFSTLKYVNSLLAQEIVLAQSLCDSLQFLNTETGMIVMSVQLKAMVGRVNIIKEMAECRVRSTCYPEAPAEEVTAVFQKVRDLVELCGRCTEIMAERQEAIKARERRLIETLR